MSDVEVVNAAWFICFSVFVIWYKICVFRLKIWCKAFFFLFNEIKILILLI